MKTLSTKSKVQNKTSIISMGAVSLHVQNVAVLKRFYHEVLQLDLISESDNVVVLGHGEKRLLQLHTQDTATKTLPTHAGLYHLAILYASRAQLAQTLVHIFTKWQGYFVGSADHLVSEAFYFTDPEGNGIELYFDKESHLWEWENGTVQMASLYIDPISYIRTHHGTNDTEHDRTMGHVHLKVGDIETAKQFYVDVLGFTVTASLPGALFVSRDHYHHHIGMNTWESRGATKREGYSGLKSYEIHIHSKKEFETIKKNLITHAIGYSEIASGISFHDPWNNMVILHHGTNDRKN